MHRVDAVLFNEQRGSSIEFKLWLAFNIVTDADLAQTQTFPKTDTHRLGRGFLSGETLRQKMGGVGIHSEIPELIIGQQSFGKTVTESFQILLHARHAYDIGADTKYHSGATSRISSFISPTASCSPVNMARATIAWPMFNSCTPGIAAIC